MGAGIPMTAPLLDLDQPIHSRWSDDCPNKLTGPECDCNDCRNWLNSTLDTTTCVRGECCCLPPAEETA